LWREINAALAATSEGAVVAVSGRAKVLAVASIVLWVLAIIFGRLIAYIMDYMILNGHR